MCLARGYRPAGYFTIVRTWERLAPGRLAQEAGDGLDWRINVLAFPELYMIPDEPIMKKAGQLFNVDESLNALQDDPDLSLLRYRGPRDDVLTAEPKLTLGFGMWMRIIRYSEDLPRINYLIQKFNVAAWLRCSNWREGVGWISNVMKKTGMHGFQYLVDYATFAGYDSGLSDEEVILGVKDWCGEIKHRGPGGEGSLENAAWLDAVESRVYNFLAPLVLKTTLSEPLLTPETYAHNPVMWGTTGSVLYDKKRKLTGLGDNGIVTAKQTKWAAAAVIPPEAVLHALRTKRRGYAKAIIKRETKKSRLVIAADLEGYWQQDYLSESFMDAVLASNEASTLWMSSRQTGEYWDELTKMIRRIVCMPLDQSEFDRNQTRMMIISCMKGVRRAMALKMPDWWLEILDNAVYNMVHGYVLAAGVKIPYRNGVLSGWRWTAMLDTLLNKSVTEVAEQAASVVPLASVYQGDDVEARFASVADAFDVWVRIQDWGFQVNPFKFFVSAGGRTEFLRRYVDNGRIAGYPARSINALSWRNPINAPTPPGIERVSEMYSQWVLFCARANADLPAEALPDIARANELSPQTVKVWTETPRAWGGASILPTMRRSGLIIESSVPEDQIRMRTTPGIASTAAEISRLFGVGHTESMVKRWWSNTVDWRSTKYTSATAKRTIIRAPIQLRFGSAPLPPLEITRLTRLARMYANLIPEVADVVLKQYPDWWSGAQHTIRSETLLGKTLFSTPDVKGVDPTWLAIYLDQQLRCALATLYGLRVRNETARRQIQETVDIGAARVLGLREGEGRIVIR